MMTKTSPKAILFTMKSFLKAGIFSLWLTQALWSSPSWAELQPHEYECAHPPMDRMDRLRFSRKTQLSISADSTLLDGAITSYPPSKTTFDRTLSARARAGIIAIGSPQLAIYSRFETSSHLRKIESEDEPRLQQEQLMHNAGVGLGITFITTSNLELSVGADLKQMPGFEYKSVTPSVTATTEVSATRAIIPSFVVLKRLGSGGAGGLFYTPSRVTSRTITRIADIESSFSEETLFPESIGVLGKSLILGNKLEAEIAAVNLTDGGPRKSNNQTALDDYLRIYAIISRVIPAPVPTELALGLFHKTLSYAANTDVSLFSIPLSHLQLMLKIGTEDRYINVGATYTYGKDRQSIPEFNADYLASGPGGTATISWAF
jgi:hypothetical protein